MTPVFLDTEFTSLLDPHLLSVGLVTLDGRRHYAELDLKSDLGITRWAMTPYDVRENVIEDKWGLFPEASCDSELSIGLRVGEWLLQVADSDSEGRIELLYDYSTDLELLVGALQECNLWPQVRLVASERNVAEFTGTIGPELASEATFKALRRRQPPLFRHHALADAIALRAAWCTALVTQELGRLPSDSADFYESLATPSPTLGDKAPLDLIELPDDLSAFMAALGTLSASESR